MENITKITSFNLEDDTNITPLEWINVAYKPWRKIFIYIHSMEDICKHLSKTKYIHLYNSEITFKFW